MACRTRVVASGVDMSALDVHTGTTPKEVSVMRTTEHEGRPSSCRRCLVGRLMELADDMDEHVDRLRTCDPVDANAELDAYNRASDEFHDVCERLGVLFGQGWAIVHGKRAERDAMAEIVNS